MRNHQNRNVSSMRLLAAAVTSVLSLSAVVAAPGDSWLTVTWPQQIGATMWDYSEGSGQATNPRNLSVTDGRIQDVDFGSNGVLYAAATFNDAGIYTVQNNGSMNRIATIGGTGEGDMTYDPVQDRLLVSQGPFDKNIYQVDLTNNSYSVSVFYTAAGYDDIQGLAADSSGIWAVHSLINSTGQSELLKWNGSGFTSYGSLGPGFGSACGMDINAAGEIYVLSSGGSLYKVNPIFGAPVLTQVDQVSNSSGEFYTGLAAVPEPTTVLALGAGIAALAARRKRSR